MDQSTHTCPHGQEPDSCRIAERMKRLVARLRNEEAQLAAQAARFWLPLSEQAVFSELCAAKAAAASAVESELRACGVAL